MLISSRNTFTDKPRNDVLPAMWVLPSSVKQTRKTNHHNACTLCDKVPGKNDYEGKISFLEGRQVIVLRRQRGGSPSGRTPAPSMRVHRHSWDGGSRGHHADSTFWTPTMSVTCRRGRASRTPSLLHDQDPPKART